MIRNRILVHSSTLKRSYRIGLRLSNGLQIRSDNEDRNSKWPT